MSEVDNQFNLLNNVMYNLYYDPNNDKYNILLYDYIIKLNEIKKLNEELSSSKNDSELQIKIQKAEEEIKKTVDLNYIYQRIHPILKKENNEVLSIFSKNDFIEMTVISIDIRKSTELMLKSKTPDNYSEFISGLMEGLKNIIINNYGVFDKFTGDGILAYFPTLYSGKDGILNCCLVSQECHKYFNDYYPKNYDKFSVVLDTGLGIGIDHGFVKIVKINYEQTIVGSPVIYACRLAGAPAYNTYLNINAYYEIVKYGINSQETKMEIKNEGKIIVYKLEEILDKNISIPDWAKDQK